MKSENIRISVVVPVYNVEKYLHKCVSSVLKQTYKNIELILVDDGSPDNCPQLCDEYAKKDNRIKVVHKSNGGLSSARNAGIKTATGEYVMFLDSDDYWETENLVFEIVDRINESDADVICFGYKEYFDDSNSYGKGVYDDTLLKCYGNENHLLRNMLATGSYVSSSCTKAVRASLFLDDDMFFIEGITSEDVDWSARLMIKTSKFAVYPKSAYIYRQRASSIVHTIKVENLKIFADNILRCLSYAEDIHNKELLDNYYNYVAYQYICFLRVALLCIKDKRTKNIIQEMKQYRWLLNFHLNKKVKIVYWFNKLLGYNMMFKALKLYSKVR